MSDVSEGKPCPVCGRPMSLTPTQEDLGLGVNVGTSYLHFWERGGVNGTYLCGRCAKLAGDAVDDRREGAAGALCALLARAFGRGLVG